MPRELKQQCLELLICHPVLLNNFNLHAESNSKRILSDFLIEIVPRLEDQRALALLRQKSLHSVKKSLGKDGSKLR